MLLTTDPPIALFDLDNTLADYSAAIVEGMARISLPGDPPWVSSIDESPVYEARRKLIISKPGWWRALKPFQMGFEILEQVKRHGFECYICSKGPAHHPMAWAEKVAWCQEHVPGLPIILADNKSLVYGRVLVDDWPKYGSKWLKHRPRGLWIIPSQPWNECVAEGTGVLKYHNGIDRELVSERLVSVGGTKP